MALAKPTIEFTAVTSFPLVTAENPLAGASVRELSKDPRTGDKTVVLYHAPGQEWGGPEGCETQACHNYWEECLILEGRLFDKTLQKWFGGTLQQLIK